MCWVDTLYTDPKSTHIYINLAPRNRNTPSLWGRREPMQKVTRPARALALSVLRGTPIFNFNCILTSANQPPAKKRLHLAPPASRRRLFLINDNNNLIPKLALPLQPPIWDWPLSSSRAPRAISTHWMIVSLIYEVRKSKEQILHFWSMSCIEQNPPLPFRWNVQIRP